jgi:hypothetical protein
MADTFISKSQFLKALQCPKSLYLYKYHPELIEEADESREAIFHCGQEVGVFARGLFPDGVEIFFDGQNFTAQLEQTKKEIDKGVKILYEPAFSNDGLFIKADILRKQNKGWELYEVKNSTKIKEDAFHFEDVAFQYHVLRENGLSVNKAHLVHINNQYERQGDIELNKLFTINDITKDVKGIQKQIKEQIKLQRKILSGKMPKIDIGQYCSSPYDCEFQGHCWQHIPEESVFNLRGRGIKPFDFYKKGKILLKDIPIHGLPSSGQLQLECALEKKSCINKGALQEFLDSLWYPLYFLDFETFMEPIPLFNVTRPYQHIPFQYSLHSMSKKGGKLTHYEYLAPPNIDPRKPLIEKLIKEIPKNACVVVYNMSFEKGVLNNLKVWFPRYEKRIDNIIKNMRDLMVPFRKQHFYSWQMQGSYSIKAVLPTLVPELSYDSLEITEGGMAMLEYKRMCDSNDPSEIKAIRKALLEYCKLDTLGMLKIVDRLKETCLNP